MTTHQRAKTPLSFFHMNCYICNKEMSHRDYVKRILKKERGLVTWIRVERLACNDCGVVRRNLPDCVVRFKHYEKRIIQGVISGTITPDILEYEDYPCEMTMKRWKS